ncbi:MAG TPA: hypothetical protein VD794_00485, partial [Flavisolibacter sp.]|nr:hypothetical protein [Flavisolibacter sp.]
IYQLLCSSDRMGTLPERVKQTRARKIMRDIEAYMTGRAGTQEIYRNVPNSCPDDITLCRILQAFDLP